MTKEPGNIKYLKKKNRLNVLNAIKDNEPVARLQLSQMTGLTPPAITMITRELLDSGLIREVGLGKSRGGRKPVKLIIVPDAAFVIGIELTHYETTIGIADLKNDPTDIYTVSLDMTDPASGLNGLMGELRRIIEQRYASKRFLGVGIAFPGLLNARTGIIRQSINLGPGWDWFPLKETMEAQLGLPVIIENNSKASAMAEHWFSGGIGCTNITYINLGEGISAGVILGDRIVQGFQGYGGQLGHIVLKEDGALCNCGNRGCLEALCSVPALLRTAAAELPVLKKDDPLKIVYETKGSVCLGDILDCAAIEHSYAWQLLREAGRLVGLATASIINLFNPEKIFLGGRVARSAPVFSDAVRDTVRSHSFPAIAEVAEILVSKLEKNAAVIGACALAIRELLQSYDSELLEEMQSRKEPEDRPERKNEGVW
ncbi:MAG: ROK family transcriptional regulator [Negativicutes bacterium]|nr:ROK family transcriptional regulator [Negativicutes bacterium]